MIDPPMRPGLEWFIYIETLGILSFAINAMIVAKAKGLSPLGIFICAFVASLGGGTLRDILLGPSAQPFFWINFPFYIVAIFGASIAYAQVGLFERLIAKRDFVIKETAEAMALASFGALGAVKAYNILAPGMAPGLLGLAQIWVLCAFLGAAGAAFGSILRDVLINEFPGALKPGVFVLEALFVGCGVITALRMLDIAQPWAMLVGFVVILAIRAPVIFAKRPR